ncbi:uncharacterized protein V6R79_016315 [Siganus canaliculatus]
MAAIYSGIHLKLKSPQTPWEDKLKLARFAWISTQCLLPNKEQVLLDWCTHALTGWYSQKVQFSQNVLEGLWCYLDDLLHSKKLHCFLKQGKTISLRLNMAQLLLERLQEFSHDGSKSPVCMSTILSVCQGLIASPSLSSVFTTKYELMVDLLVKICHLACRQLRQPSLTEPLTVEPVISQDGKSPAILKEEQPAKNLPDQTESDSPKPRENFRSANLFEVLLQVLSCYLSVQRQQTNPNRVFTVVTNQLLQMLALLRHLLTSGKFSPSHAHLRVHQQLRNDIRVKIDAVLQLALFPSELLVAYKDELNSSKEDSGKRGPGGVKGSLKPVAAILSQLTSPGDCDPSLHYNVKSNTSALLFRFFLESFRKVRGDNEEAHKMLCFHFLTRLVPTLDFSLEGDSPSVSSVRAEQTDSPPSASLCSPESWSLALLTLESLLSQALSADIYNVAADRIRHGEVQLNFYKALAQMLLNQAQPSIPAWYSCLKVLLNLNHLILEPDLDQLSSSAWVDSECMEAQVQEARQLMVCSLLQTYTKLRQLPRLFTELLSVICQPALDHLRPPLLSEGISASLRTCLLDAPPSQVIEICSLVLESIRKYILPVLVRMEAEVEKMEVDGGGDFTETNEEMKVDQEREDASLKLSSLSQLLHAVLFSLKTLDNTSPLPLVRQSQKMMEEMQQVVNELICDLSNKSKELEDISGSKSKGQWQQKTQEAALLLRYTWVEVDTLFCIHCSKYTSLDSAQSATDSETEGHNLGLNQIESLLSGESFPAHLHSSCSPMSRLLLKLLTLQQMKKALLKIPLLSEASTVALLNKAAHFILTETQFEVSLDTQQVWDGQIGSVTADSYSVAHWYFLTSNLPVIAAYLSREDMNCVANALVSSLLCSQINQGKEPLPSGCLTVALISSQLLQSPVHVELPALFSATVCSLTRRIVGVLKAANVHKSCPTLLKFQETGSGSKSRQVLSTVEEKEAAVEDLLASSKTGEVAALLTDTQSKELVDILQILADLNSDGMNPEDLSSVFLLLLFLFTSTSSQTGPEPGDDVVLQVKLLKILTCLLEGKNFQSVLKLIHGGTLLQAVLSSLLSQRNSRRFKATSTSDWLELIKAMQVFIRCLVQLIIIRNSSVRLNLDQFVSYLTSEELASKQLVTPSAAASSDDTASYFSIHLLLASLTSFSQAVSSNLGRSKQMDATLIQTLTRTTALLGPAVQSILTPQTVSGSVVQPAGVLGQAFIVEVVTVMLQCELSSLSVQDKQKDTKLSHMNLYEHFGQQILREISSAQRPMNFLVSSLHFLAAFYKAVRMTGADGEEKKRGQEVDELYLQMLQNVHRLLAAPWLSPSEISELEPAVKELLRHLVEKSTTGQFNLLLVMVRDGLDVVPLRAGKYRGVLSAVIMVKQLSCCQLPEPCSKALWLFVPQIISAMVFLVKSSSQDTSLTLPFTVPTVMSMTSLLRQGEGLITNPHHVTLVLGALQSVPLDRLTPGVYQSTFLAVHEALFAIVQCHSQVMLNAAPSFLNVFHRLLASIMQEGRQRGDSDTGSDVYLECSRLIERMYSHIAATSESFTTLSAFTVAQYVTELQKVTLRPDIKLHLTEGIYSILDLCTEQDIKFLTAGLQMGVREVFSELYGSYTHYHKAQRQGEDKYTV